MSDMETSIGGPDEEGASPERAARGPVLSQRDYRPTPYRDTTWEIVGEVVEERDFVPMELEVHRTELADADPMFENFDKRIAGSGDMVYHLPGNARFSGEKKEESEENGLTPEIVEEMLAAKFAEGKEAGFQEGLQAGELKVVERYDEISGRIQQVSQQIVQQLQAQMAKVEQQAFELSLNISKKILETTADIRPEYIIDVIAAAMKSLGAGKPLRVRLSPNDFEFYEVVGLPAELSAEELGISYVPDETVKSGCVVETDFGEVDFQLDRMWEQIREQLYEVRRG